MKIPSLLAFSTLALLAAQPLATAQQPIELKPRWTVGTTYVQEMKMQQDTKLEFGGQKMNQSVVTTQEVATKVTPHEDGQRKRLNQKYQKMTMDMDMAGQKMHFDSSKPDATVDPMGLSKALGPLVGKELRIVVDANNEVTDVENIDEITKPLAAANPIAAQMMSGMFTKEVIAQSFKQVGLKSLPGKPVKTGDSWPYSVTMNLPQIGVIALNGNYTVKGMAQHNGGMCAELAEEGTVSMNLDAAMAASGAAAPQAPKMNMKVKSGSIFGTVWFDPALGTARDTATTQTLMMQMNNPMNPAETINIPMTQTISLKLISAGPAK